MIRAEQEIQVRWRDLDAMQHVNNAVYLTYLETAREAWFAELLAGTTADSMQFAIRRLEVDFLSQVTVADGPLRVEVESAGVGTSSLSTHERIYAGSDGRLVLEAVCVSVHLDATKLRSAPLPEMLRSRLV